MNITKLLGIKTVEKSNKRIKYFFYIPFYTEKWKGNVLKNTILLFPLSKLEINGEDIKLYFLSIKVATFKGFAKKLTLGVENSILLKELKAFEILAQRSSCKYEEEMK